MAAPIDLLYVDGPPPSWSDALVSGLADVFPNPIRLVRAEVDLQPCFVPNRQQHHATLVLAALLRERQDPGSKILGIVPVDLFIPVLTFVFGQAQLAGPGAVVSTYRLRSEFYGLPSDEGVLVERAIKECVHELGHTFGLVHCDFYDCVMHAASSVDEVDVRSAVFCAHCVSEMEGRGWE